MKKKRRCLLGSFLIILGILMVSLGCLLTTLPPNQYQYVVPAGNLSESWQGASQALEALADVIDVASISGRKQDVQFPGSREEVNVTLYAIDAYYAELCHENLIAGRLISESDVQKQRNVMVIDRDTAYALFTGGEVIGQTLTIDGIDWTIVGVVGSKVRLGESAEAIAFVPISSVAAQHLPMDTLEIRLSAKVGSGHAALLQTALEQWRSDGTFHALEREKYAALMPLHWTTVVIGLLCTIALVRWVCRVAKEHYLLCQQKLQSHYPHQMIGWLAAAIASLLLLGGAAAGVMLISMKLLTTPVLVFTDWIPENPVSITSYVTRFWAIHHESAKAIQYISREMSIVMLASWLIRWGTIATLGGCLITTNKRRNTK